jgi:hypothetical protein
MEGFGTARAYDTGSSAARTRTVIRRRLPLQIFIAAIAAMFLLEGGLLWTLGYNYTGLTGSPLTKIHPATYLTVLAFVCLCFEQANPIGTCVDLGRKRPGCFLLIVAAFFQFVITVSHGGPGAAGIVDGFVLPPLAVMIFSETDLLTRDKLERLIHAVMIGNAVMGLVELALKHPIFPYRFDGAYSIYDMRPTALQGHPLGDALVTAMYTLALISGGGTLVAWPRLGIVLLQLAALVAFGGRSALVVTVLTGGVYSIGILFRVLRTGRVPLLGAAVAILAVTTVPIIVFALVHQGFFDPILARFEDDGGSALARVKIANLFGAIPLTDLLVGPDPVLVDDLRRINGLELGIENPIARLALYQGALVTALTVVATGVFLHELTRFSRRGMLLPMIGFLIIINTFESLGSKSTLLTKFAVMMLVLFRPVAVTKAPEKSASAGFRDARSRNGVFAGPGSIQSRRAGRGSLRLPGHFEA